jgi:hypothetical protein
MTQHMSNDELSTEGIRALHQLRACEKSERNAVSGEPGWFWSLPPHGPGAIRELERLHLAYARFFPDVERGVGQLRLAVQLTPSGKKMRLPELPVESAESAYTDEA